MFRAAPCQPRRAARRGRIGVPAALVAVLVGALLAAAGPAAAANPPGPDDPIGAVSFATNADGSVLARGWAADPDDRTANASVLSLVDGRVAATTPTSLARPRLSTARNLGPTPGFSVTVPVSAGTRHTVCIAVANTGPGLARVLGCASGAPAGGHSPVGQLQSATATASSLTVAGWSRDPDFNARRSVVVLYVDGSSVATVTTGRATAAQRAAGSSPRGAFRITVPASPGAHLACLWVVNVALGSNSSLGCDPVDTRGPGGTADLSTVPRANRVAATAAVGQVGDGYAWAAAGPSTFDCSGLVLWAYNKAGIGTVHQSASQFAQARVIPASRAVRGDLVFYHDAIGSVYHVGIYLKPGLSVAAIDTAQGVDYQTIWDATATYGSFTHD